MTIDSNKAIVSGNPEEICTFLKDSNNLIHLLPQDNITDFTSTDEICSFKVQGGITISLLQDGQEGVEKLFLKSGEKSPLHFV